jgi:hypothetical protein
MLQSGLRHNPAHLRAATRKQNEENRFGATRASKSGTRGVFWDRSRGRWVASVSHYGQQRRKRFATRDEAESTALAWRLELFTHNDMDRTG